MSRVRFKLNRRGVREVLTSESVGTECGKYAERVLGQCGEGYMQENRKYPERTGAAVYPGNDDAYYDNLSHNTLEKALKNLGEQND